MHPHTFDKNLSGARREIQLRRTANNAISSILPTAIGRKTLIINDIPKEISFTSDERLITVILSDLLLNTVNSSNSSCIWISACKEYGETSITIKDNHSDYSKYISGKMTKVQPIVKKLGGQLQFEFNKRENITVILSFCPKATA